MEFASAYFLCISPRSLLCYLIIKLSSFHIQRLILRGEGKRSPDNYIKNGKYGVFKVDIVHLFLNGKPTSCDSMNSQSFLYLCCIILEVQRQLYGFCANKSSFFRSAGAFKTSFS